MTSQQFLTALANGRWLATLNPTEVNVLLVYAAHAKPNGEAFPKAETVAEMIGYTHCSTVNRARKTLVAKQLLEPVSRSRSKSVYRINFDRLKSASQALTGNVPDTHKCVGGISAGHASDECVAGTFNGACDAPDNKEEPANEPAIEPDTLSGRAPRRVLVNPGASPDVLAAIYEAYPRRKKRPAAMKAIAKALEFLAARGRPPVGHETWAAWLTARTRAFAAHRDAEIASGRSEARFTPYPATWFNGEGYDEVLDEAESADVADSDSAAYRAAVPEARMTPEESRALWLTTEPGRRWLAQQQAQQSTASSPKEAVGHG